LLEDFLRQNKGKLTRDDLTDKVKRRLRTQAERAKRTLSSSAQTNIEVESLCKGIDFNTTLTRAKFEELCSHLFRETLDSVQKALNDAKMSKSDIHEVVLVGGSTRIPKVQQILSEYFGGKELCKSINPDEAVAYGAAVQAAILAGTAEGDANKMILIDVTPLSLGIETSGQFMTNLIDRNTNIPCKRSQIFSTFADNQPAVTIRVYEGERKFTRDNNLLAQFNLEGIAPAPRGVPQIEVTFDLDSNGILKVMAVDKGTGKQQSIRIENNTGRLSKNDIERMVEEGKKFEEQDKNNFEKAQARNNFEQDLYRVKNALEDNKDKMKDKDIDEGQIEEVRKCLKEYQEWLDSNPTDVGKEEYEEKSNKLNKLFHPISAKLYQNSNPSSGNDDDLDESYGGGMPGGMPNLSPDQMKMFQEMMSDPAKRAQMEKMAANMFGGGGMPGGMPAGMSGMPGMPKKPKSKSGPTIEEVE
jgi:L1 cell adhesion molecule like protein